MCGPPRAPRPGKDRARPLDLQTTILRARRASDATVMKGSAEKTEAVTLCARRLESPETGTSLRPAEVPTETVTSRYSGTVRRREDPQN